MRRKHLPVKPERGYQWLVPVWIGAISFFIAVRTVLDGQYTFGEPDGILITVTERPIAFWAGVAFPATVGIAMLALIVRGELRFRADLQTYDELAQGGQDQAAAEAKKTARRN